MRLPDHTVLLIREIMAISGVAFAGDPARVRDGALGRPGRSLRALAASPQEFERKVMWWFESAVAATAYASSTKDTKFH
jgi:hypothetical protein